ncbi:hypothetical protein JCM8547_001537 [Rhodosporidiobolus lusitaniae]
MQPQDLAPVSSSSPRLPPPLRRRIIESLNPLDGMDLRTLAKLARVSTQSAKIAQRLLLQSVCVYNVNTGFFRDLNHLFSSSLKSRPEPSVEAYGYEDAFLALCPKIEAVHLTRHGDMRNSRNEDEDEDEEGDGFGALRVLAVEALTTASNVPSRPPTATPHLPAELVAKIIRAVDPLEFGHFRTLAALCRLSKGYTELARRRLYSVVPIYDLRDEFVKTFFSKAERRAVSRSEEDHLFKCTDLSEYRPVTDEIARARLVALDKHSHLAASPKKLVYYGYFETYGAFLTIGRNLQTCPNISSVHLVRNLETSSSTGVEFRDLQFDDFGFQALEPLVVMQGRVVDLTLVGLSRANARTTVARVMREFKNLERFSFTIDNSDVYVDFVHRAWTPTPSFSLKSFSTSVVLPSPYLSNLLHASSSSLTSLEIAVSRESLELSTLTSLSRLALEFYHPSVVRDTLATVSSFAPLAHLELRYLWRLERDALSLTDEDEDDEQEEDGGTYAASRDEAHEKDGSFAALLAGLPSTLSHLSLPFLLEDFPAPSSSLPPEPALDVLLASLSRPFFCPDLRILDVADPAKAKRDMYGAENEPTEEELERFEMKREKLREGCEKRGVWLSERGRRSMKLGARRGWCLGCRDE